MMLLETPAGDIFDLNRPPFKVLPGQSAELAAEDILRAFEAIGQRHDKASLTFAALSHGLEGLQEQPLAVAGGKIAASIDCGVGAGLGNAYHNHQHFCEVMMSACFIAMLDGLEADSRLVVLLAALIHDFHHDGAGNRGTPFRLERIAVTESMPYLAAAGVPEVQQRLLAALVLSTEVPRGLAIVRGCHAHHQNGAPLPAIHVAAPELEELAQHPLQARLAQIICEADVLPSIGLSIAHALQLQDALAKEWNMSLGLEDKYQFMTQESARLSVGKFFQPNVERLEQHLRRHLGY